MLQHKCHTIHLNSLDLKTEIQECVFEFGWRMIHFYRLFSTGRNCACKTLTPTWNATLDGLNPDLSVLTLLQWCFNHPNWCIIFDILCFKLQCIRNNLSSCCRSAIWKNNLASLLNRSGLIHVTMSDHFQLHRPPKITPSRENEHVTWKKGTINFKRYI